MELQKSMTELVDPTSDTSVDSATTATATSSTTSLATTSKHAVETVDDAKQTLKKIESDLADYRAAKALVPLDLETSEEGVKRIITNPANCDMLTRYGLDESVMPRTDYSSSSAILVSMLAFPLAFAGTLALLGVSGAALGYLSLAGFLASTIFGMVTDLRDQRTPADLIRTRIIFRKRFAREVRRITQQNLSNAERNQKLLAGRDKKLERAQKRVAVLASSYEQNNPGMTLEISRDRTSVVEATKKVKPVDTKNALARKIIGTEATEGN